MIRMSPHRRRLYEQAEQRRKLCEEWLVFLMAKSREKIATKQELRNEAMKRWGLSKKAFDAGWIRAIEATGNYDWYDPMLKRKDRSDLNERLKFD